MNDILDLVVDLNSMDETGRPWAFLDAARDPARIVPGAHIVVGSWRRAIATVVDVADGIVHVKPLRGPVSAHGHLLGDRQAS